ncbi:hypothetical protein VFPPC_15137 [Pochonia chlamydosporia 170]|uniref:Uncharacterized protein n=1 Tax=Pochonia chlamydosporia 170 TaxID=1380566 RepID=A0A179G3U5_METCM|nr:hypothetical protein VFPPC_15137 [Pochonia chlamydosporia 170]OAQ72457.1 hypothetical protein VFPPC_15137 [Pochonia chlamydosporia 170]
MVTELLGYRALPTAAIMHGYVIAFFKTAGACVLSIIVNNMPQASKTSSIPCL